MSNIYKSAVCVSFILGLCACSSLPEEASQEVVKEAHYQPIHRLNRSDTIKSDTANTNYEKNEKNETTTLVAKVPVLPELQKTPEKERKPFPVVRKKQPLGISYQAAEILFADGSSSLAGDSLAEIKKLAGIIKKYDAAVMVYGFSSSRTRDVDPATHKLINFNVSLKRAQAVADALKSYGFKDKKITVEGLSDTYPKYSEAMPAGERLNRRAEVYISY